MKLETLQNEMYSAMKARDKERKNSISALVSAVKKAGIDAGYHEDIPEEIVDKVILKEIKTVNEQIETCPAERTDLLESYNTRKAVFEEFAPKMMNVDEIKAYITANFADIVEAKNKGMAMKTIMPALKGKADGKDINMVVTELLK